MALGYAHYVAFGALAAVGSGIQVVAETATHHAHLSATGAACALAVIGVLQTWVDPLRSYLLRDGLAAVAVLAAAATTWVGASVATASLLMAAVVVGSVLIDVLASEPD